MKEHSQSMWLLAKRIAIRMARLAILGWCLSATLLWLGQDLLLFPGCPAPLGDPLAPGIDVQPLDLNVAPGVRLHGWLARPANVPPATRLPTLLYFGGNAEDVSTAVVWAARLGGWAVLTFNYRGFAGNPGSPSEQAFVADALAIHDLAASLAGVDASHIAVAGRSLGSGVAVQLAARRPLNCLILITPYDSIAALAHRRFAWLPTDLILRNRFDSLAIARHTQTPALLVIADHDVVVPAEHGLALYAAWQGPRQLLRSKEHGHGDILSDPAVWQSMRSWLAPGLKRP